MGGEQICAKRTRLKRGKPGSRSDERHVRCGLALKHLADKHKLSTLVPKADAVADHTLAEHRRELGREIAHLIGMREKDQVWLRRFDDLSERDGVAVRCVVLQQVLVDEEDF